MLLAALAVVLVTVKLVISVVPNGVLPKSNSMDEMTAISACLASGYERGEPPQPSRSGSLSAGARHERQTGERKASGQIRVNHAPPPFRPTYHTHGALLQKHKHLSAISRTNLSYTLSRLSAALSAVRPLCYAPSLLCAPIYLAYRASVSTRDFSQD